VQIPEDKLLELLQSPGAPDQATQAESELPDQVDTDTDTGLLAKFGIDPMGLIGGKFGL
jgi:hypothetical protein